MCFGVKCTRKLLEISQSAFRSLYSVNSQDQKSAFQGTLKTGFQINTSDTINVTLSISKPFLSEASYVSPVHITSFQQNSSAYTADSCALFTNPDVA